MNQVTYYLNSTEDLVISRLGSEIIVGQVSYEDWQDDFSGSSGKAYECYHSRKDGERESIYDYAFKYGKWSKKIPLPWKNFHRKLWGLKPLKEENPLPEWYLEWDRDVCPTPENVPDSSIPQSFRIWADIHGNRKHWYGNREYFKTWVFTAATSLVVEELVPLLKDSEFVIKIKCW